MIVAVCITPPAHAETLRDVVERAVRTNPSITSSEANRRATEFELRQSEGRWLPRIDVEADGGKERIDRPAGFAFNVNDHWRTRRQGAATLSQTLFDGWDRSNDVYRHTARVNAAAARVLARSEMIALEAIEAHIDVRRHQRVIRMAQNSLGIHRRILSLVKEQAQAGKVAQSDVIQVEERRAAAEVTVERVRQSLLDAEAKFLRLVGERPRNLEAAGYPAGVPMSRREAVEQGLAKSPLVAAAGADVDVARLAFEQSKSASYPTISLEVRRATALEAGGTPGPSNETQARVVLRWALFDGFIARNRQFEFAERMAQANAERDERIRLVREELDRAMSAYYTGGLRLPPLRRQAELARRVVSNYETEYKLAKRSLLELLNAENARLNAAMDLANSEALHVFSAYRILGAMGSILEVMGVQPPAAASALEPRHR